MLPQGRPSWGAACYLWSAVVPLEVADVQARSGHTANLALRWRRQERASNHVSCVSSSQHAFSSSEEQPLSLLVPPVFEAHRRGCLRSRQQRTMRVDLPLTLEGSKTLRRRRRAALWMGGVALLCAAVAALAGSVEALSCRSLWRRLVRSLPVVDGFRSPRLVDMGEPGLWRLSGIDRKLAIECERQGERSWEFDYWNRR